jgi:hypothetical protein
MKNDTSLSLTAAIILAGVVLAFVNPADANDAATASNAVENTVAIPAATNAMAASDVHGAVGPHARSPRTKASCEHVRRADPRA